MQAGGLVIFYGMEQSAARIHMHTLLAQQQDGFQTLTLTTTELSKAWTSADEISYQGKLFDVKSVTINGSSAAVTVVADTDEDEITARVNVLNNKEKPGKQQGGIIHQLVELLMLAYVQPMPLQYLVFHDAVDVPHSAYQAHILACSGKIFIPPPKVA